MGKFVKWQVAIYAVLAAWAGATIVLGGMFGTVKAMLIFPPVVASFCLITALYGLWSRRVSRLAASLNGVMLVLGGVLTSPVNDQSFFGQVVLWALTLTVVCSLLPGWCAQRGLGSFGRRRFLGGLLWAVAAVVSLGVGGYGLAAWLSTLPGSPLPMEAFYHSGPETEAFLEPKSLEGQWRLWDLREQRPFTGTARILAPQLRLNPLPRRVMGLACFQEGFRLGQSVAPLRYQRAGYSIASPEGPFSPPLLHRRYRAVLEAHIDGWGRYCAFETATPDGRRGVVVVFVDREGRLNRWRINYHRGTEVVSQIFPSRMEPQGGWINGRPAAAFDGLGFPLDDGLAKRQPWRAGDFLAQPLEDLVWTRRSLDEDLIQQFTAPETPGLLPRYHGWGDRPTLENLLIAAGIDESQEVAVWIASSQGRRLLTAQERELVERGLSAARLGTTVLDPRPWAPELFPSRFEFEASGRRLVLFWRDGRFFCDDGLYLLSLEDAAEDLKGSMEDLVRSWLTGE